MAETAYIANVVMRTEGFVEQCRRFFPGVELISTSSTSGSDSLVIPLMRRNKVPVGRKDELFELVDALESPDDAPILRVAGLKDPRKLKGRSGGNDWSVVASLEPGGLMQKQGRVANKIAAWLGGSNVRYTTGMNAEDPHMRVGRARTEQQAAEVGDLLMRCLEGRNLKLGSPEVLISR